jgi:hypothetical protein
MTRRSSLTALASSLVALALLAFPVAAKEGGTAMLDTAIPRDAEPGSTIDVGWVAYVNDPAGRQPITGSPVFIRLVPLTGDSTEASGRETTARSGHYTASIVVPAGGIARVESGLRGESCDESGCKRSDWMFAIVGTALADPVAAVAPEPVADPVADPAAAPAGARTTSPSSTSIVPWVLLAAAGVAAGIAVIALGRRRLRGEGAPV